MVLKKDLIKFFKKFKKYKINTIREDADRDRDIKIAK